MNTHHFVKTNRYLNRIAQGSLGILVVFMLVLLMPVCGEESRAAEEDKARTIITPTVSVALAGEVSMDIMPTSTGQFGENSTMVQVATTNSAGYSIYLNTADSTNAMVNVTYPTQQINAMSVPASGNGFEANSWGFAIARTGSADILTY